MMSFGVLDAVIAVGPLDHRVAGSLDKAAQRIAVGIRVVDDQNGGGFLAHERLQCC